MAVDNEVIEWLWDLFDSECLGHLVDVGAGNGKSGSLTRTLLIKKGWDGLLIDPLPSHAFALRHLYSGIGRVKVLDVAVMPESGKGLLYPFREVSTTRKDWAKACDDWWGHVRYSEPLTVTFRTLNEILETEEIPPEFDLLKIDTEGMDFPILQSLDWTKWTPLVVVTEILDMLHPGKKRWEAPRELVEFMEGVGYSVALVSRGGNAIFRRKN